MKSYQDTNAHREEMLERVPDRAGRILLSGLFSLQDYVEGSIDAAIHADHFILHPERVPGDCYANATVEIYRFAAQALEYGLETQNLARVAAYIRQCAGLKKRVERTIRPLVNRITFNHITHTSAT